MKPTGYVTFLFTDIEGSTKLAQEFPETIHSALERHNSIINDAVESNNGFVFEIVGDAFCCAFENTNDAIKAAIDIQINLNSESWEDAVIKTKIGIHSGNVEWSGSKYMGYITLARTARVMSSAYGGQILISEEAFKIISKDLPNLISFRDLGSRRLKDLIQPMKLYQTVTSGLISDFPPLKTLDARPNNLPIQLTNFIGREKEITEIKRILYDASLLTLLGPGGTGKTRLALQVGADIIDEFNNGVWLVELAPLTDPSLIPLTIARSLKISELPNQETEQTLTDYLKDKELLIILDNCEHLINECANISEKLLQNCPKLKIFATSREALRSDGEKVYKVMSLSHPEPNQKNTPLELSQYEAVRLFIERALAVNTNFRVTNENAPALAQICFQLDGIPLAIELAAARTSVLSVEKICNKLSDRFKLLTGGKRTALPRQQTLKALIDWSYDLLTEKEKTLLQCLSVFSGGWTLEAAEEVCTDEIISKDEIIDMQTTLLDKSLIQSSEVNGAVRFFMLESIKQYAKEVSGTNKELSFKHLNYFKKLADYEQMGLNGTSQTEWVKLIETELDNIRSAIQWATVNEPEEAFSFVNDMTEFWNIKGYFKEALQTLLRVLEIKAPVNRILRAKVLYNAGNMSLGLGNCIDSLKFGNESLLILREANDKLNLGICLNMLGVTYRFNAANEKVTNEYYNEALSIFRELGNQKQIGLTLYNLSFEVHRKGDLELALEYKKEALKICKDMNDTHQTTLTLASLGVFEFRRNNFETAKLYSEESLANAYQMGDKYLITINLVNLGCIYSGLKDYKKALELLQESLTILRECGYRASILVALMYLGEVSRKSGDDEKAIGYYKESIQIGAETGIDYYLGNNYFGLGISYFNLNDFESSLKYFTLMKEMPGNIASLIGKEKLEIAEEYLIKLKEVLGK